MMVVVRGYLRQSKEGLIRTWEYAYKGRYAIMGLNIKYLM